MDAVQATKVAWAKRHLPIDVVLDAQRSSAQADSDYFRAVTNYAKSISQVHYRKGSLLEYNGVYLTEGPWPAKAYFDARRRARTRSAAVYLDYGFTYPGSSAAGRISKSPARHGRRRGRPLPPPSNPGKSRRSRRPCTTPEAQAGAATHHASQPRSGLRPATRDHLSGPTPRRPESDPGTIVGAGWPQDIDSPDLSSLPPRKAVVPPAAAPGHGTGLSQTDLPYGGCGVIHAIPSSVPNRKGAGRFWHLRL